MDRKFVQTFLRFFCRRVFIPILYVIMVTPCFAERETYVAPPYVPLPPPKSDLMLIDNDDGTLTTPDYKLMWTKADSYAALGKCLDWHESAEYVKNLETGGYNDWRLPALEELGVIFDNTQENIISWDHDPKHPMALDKKFADGAAYWYWSDHYDKTHLADCCSRSLYFVTGVVHTRRFSSCDGGGVRAVRNIR